MRITAVTGLYDIGRSSADGRSMESYVTWLNKTLQLPIDFLVFLDPEFDDQLVTLKSSDRIIQVARDDLAMFKHRKTVQRIIDDGRGNMRDLAFKLADYGMMMMSKPDILRRAANHTDTDYLLWIDAGHCRFVEDVKLERMAPPVDFFDGLNFGLNVTPFLTQRMRIGRFSKTMVGKCLAMSSAEDFIVARSFAGELADRLDFLVEHDWLPNGRWDNEQTAFGCLLFRGGLPGVKVLNQVVRGAGNTSRMVFGHKPLLHSFTADVLWRMFLDEFRIRLEPKAECYLPNDFPEAEFQTWVENKA